MRSKKLIIGPALLLAESISAQGPNNDGVLDVFYDRNHEWAPNSNINEWAHVVCECNCGNRDIDLHRSKRQFRAVPCSNDVIIAIDTSFASRTQQDKMKDTLKS